MILDNLGTKIADGTLGMQIFASGLMPQLTLLIAGLVLVLMVAFDARGRYRTICKLGELALVASSVSAIASLYARLVCDTAPIALPSGIGHLLAVTPLSLLLNATIPLLSLCCLATSARWLRAQGLAKGEFVLLVLFATLGMQLMLVSNHFLTLYLGLELQSLSFYVLAAFQRDNRQSAEAGLKYFLLGSVASGLLLFGIALLYGLTGGLNFAEIAHHLAGKTLAIPEQAALVFVLAGIAFKLAAVPFHLWTPDVYEGAPTPVTMIFATAGKLAGLGLFMLVLFSPLYPLISQWQPLIALLAIASLLIGSLGALRQEKLKRLLGFSAIAQAGYMLLGITVGVSGLPALLLFAFTYVVASVGIFTILLAFHEKAGDSPPIALSTIAQLRGLSATHPAWAGALALFIVSLAGIPPLAGFWGKLYLLLAVFGQGYVLLTLIALLATVIGAFYYLKVAKAAYIDPVDYGQGAASKNKKASTASAPASPLQLNASPAAIAITLLTLLTTVALIGGLIPLTKLLSRVVTATFPAI
ncbi:MAG: NADH-quinone oxidoreductase subunit N [Rhodospirillaceae bacterium]|jgi:NADH-quinone oxidoreductase subunit N|nr:NADH-quinone oxidoreductase subunit N [Rhodospirillaceae bacterium]